MLQEVTRYNFLDFDLDHFSCRLEVRLSSSDLGKALRVEWNTPSLTLMMMMERMMVLMSPMALKRTSDTIDFTSQFELTIQFYFQILHLCPLYSLPLDDCQKKTTENFSDPFHPGVWTFQDLRPESPEQRDQAVGPRHRFGAGLAGDRQAPGICWSQEGGNVTFSGNFGIQLRFCWCTWLNLFLFLGITSWYFIPNLGRSKPWRLRCKHSLRSMRNVINWKRKTRSSKRQLSVLRMQRSSLFVKGGCDSIKGIKMMINIYHVSYTVVLWIKMPIGYLLGYMMRLNRRSNQLRRCASSLEDLIVLGCHHPRITLDPNQGAARWPPVKVLPRYSLASIRVDILYHCLWWCFFILNCDQSPGLETFGSTPGMSSRAFANWLPQRKRNNELWTMYRLLWWRLRENMQSMIEISRSIMYHVARGL